MPVPDGLKPRELGWETSGRMVISHKFGLCFQLEGIAHRLQRWCVAIAEDFERRLVAQVSVLVDVLDVVVRGERDVLEAVPRTPPAFEDGLARSCYFFAAHVEEVGFVFDKFDRITCLPQHVHAEEVV